MYHASDVENWQYVIHLDGTRFILKIAEQNTAQNINSARFLIFVALVLYKKQFNFFMSWTIPHD